MSNNMFEKQGLHFLAILGSIIVMSYLAQNTILDAQVRLWFIIAFLSPIVHQIIVAVAWRLELNGKNLTKRLGDKAFPIYKVLFSLFFAFRLISILYVTYLSAYSILTSIVILRIIAVVLSIPVAYLFYSVKKYFGMNRAYGADHFFEEYQKMPMVDKGIFKYFDNSMYVVGLAILYLPGLIWASMPALILAGFNHAYIWVHYFFTEKPDMNKIYG